MGILRDTYTYLKQPKVLLSMAMMGVTAYVGVKYYRSLPPEVSLTAFMAAMGARAVTEVVDYGDTLNFRTASGVVSKVNVATYDKGELLTKCSKQGIEYISRTSNKMLLRIFAQLLSIGALIFTILRLQSKQNTPKKSLDHDTNIRFKDIAGNFEAKQSLMEIIDYFKNPSRFVDMGASLPRGVLLFGPSGTGKTMLAKATACEAGVNFIECTGSEFIEMFVGVGAKRVRDIFSQARTQEPCILFIDEIECLAIRRGFISDRSNMEHHTTLNQLLTEMDGFHRSDNIVVLGATNQHQLLDEAILRPGRFDRKITVGLPDRATRAEILLLGLASRKHETSAETLSQIAEKTPEASGAELTGIINEAAFEAIRRGKDRLTDVELEFALRKFLESASQFHSYDLGNASRSYT